MSLPTLIDILTAISEHFFNNTFLKLTFILQKSAASGQQHLANKLDLDHVPTIGDKPIYDIDLAQVKEAKVLEKG